MVEQRVAASAEKDADDFDAAANGLGDEVFALDADQAGARLAGKARAQFLHSRVLPTLYNARVELLRSWRHWSDFTPVGVHGDFAMGML